jgi:hypothetical protein
MLLHILTRAEPPVGIIGAWHLRKRRFDFQAVKEICFVQALLFGCNQPDSEMMKTLMVATSQLPALEHLSLFLQVGTRIHAGSHFLLSLQAWIKHTQLPARNGHSFRPYYECMERQTGAASGHIMIAWNAQGWT